MKKRVATAIILLLCCTLLGCKDTVYVTVKDSSIYINIIIAEECRE